MKFFENIEKATFLSRPNRFVIMCRLNGKAIKAFLPNPGRLQELLLPEVKVYLEKSRSSERATTYTAVAVERDGIPVMLHTHRTNDVVHYLLKRGLVPGLEGVRVVKREVTHGKSRFDFLLAKGKEQIFLEVKSCTLFGRRVAMFPDAITQRGKRHVEELAGISKENRRGAVLFLVQWSKAEVFMPEYHTDLEFAKTLLMAKDKIKIIPLSIGWNEDLSLNLSKIKVLDIPWKIVKREAEDRGCYILILRLGKDMKTEIGKLGKINFRKGFYIYAGSAMKNLSQRVERHKRLRKNYFWHIDYLREKAEFCSALPIRSQDDLECRLAVDLSRISDWQVQGFGCSDCSCKSHLFGKGKDPLSLKEFHKILQFYRMDRLS